ncbi:MAG TPA: dephospho-CoA kinase [Candidatus Woesebacteria bacterium]|nr:dephospho-CoA kinase [Candidatus Woesebacteria bacterium]
MDRIVIGLTGSLCSGKGTLANHFRDLGFAHQILSDRLREELHSKGQEITRSALQDLGNQLRQIYGGAILAIKTAELLSDIKENIIIDGVRNPEEANYLRDVLGAKIIGVDAPVEKRLEWYLARAKDRGEDGKTYEEFERDNNRDFGLGEPSSGQQVEKCLAMADIVLWNNGTKADLNNEGDRFLKEVFDFDPEIHRLGKEK